MRYVSQNDVLFYIVFTNHAGKKNQGLVPATPQRWPSQPSHRLLRASELLLPPNRERWQVGAPKRSTRPNKAVYCQ